MSRSMLGDVAAKIGWGPTLLGVVAIAAWFHFHPPARHPKPAPRAQHQAGAVAYAPEPVRVSRTKPRKPVPVLDPAPVAITLGPKRIRAAAGDADVPPHAPYDSLGDFKRFKLAFAQEPPEHTTVFYFLRIEPAADRAVEELSGKLVLRDRQGQALYVQAWHFPHTMTPIPPSALTPGHRPVYDLLAELRRIDRHPRFHELLFTPESEVTLEWSPYYVRYADGTTAGTPDAPIDDEGLPVG